MSFKKIREKFYPDVKMNVSVYEHEKTGAIHYHTAYETTQNSFNITFKTLPNNSSGVAHILEHSVLNGSEKYPIHGVFFSLGGRNFETFLNAMTSSDLTQYPFSTIDESGYFNLMDIYLDSVFFPQLKKEVFLQEGWRYSFKDNDINNPLQFSGVVYNEMKGAYTNPDRVAYVTMMQQVFKNTQYENFSGGDPLHIPDLTYEDFKQFHKTFYHPSNSVTYTFGSINVKDIHNKLEEFLNRFDKENINNYINTENLNISGQHYEGTHPGENGFIYSKGFKIPNFKSIEELCEVEILLELLQSGKANLHDYFLQKTNKISPNGIELISNKEALIGFSFQMDEEDRETVENILSDYLNKVYTEGIAQEDVDAFFDARELMIREGELAVGNMGKYIISRYIDIANYDLPNPEEINDIKLLKSLHNKFKSKESINQLLSKYFLNNNNTFTFLSKADPKFADKVELLTKERLDIKLNQLSYDEKLHIIKEDKNLDKVRQNYRDLSILPTLSLNDINVKYPKIKDQYNKTLKPSYELYSFIEDTHGVSYLDLKYPVMVENKEDFFLSCLVLDILDSLNLKGKTLEETAVWKQSKIGYLNVNLFLVEKENQDFDTYYLASSKALSEHTANMGEKTYQYLNNLSFENKDGIINKITSLWREHISSYQQEASAYIINEAKTKFSIVSDFKKLRTFEYKSKFIKQVIQQIEAGDISIIDKLENTYKKMFNTKALGFFCGDKSSEKVIIESLNKNTNNVINVNTHSLKFLLDEKEDSSNSVVDFNMQINHVAYVLSLPEVNPIDQGKLLVLSTYLKPYLLTNVREKGGAYGVGCFFDKNGLFNFYSSRDPNTINTIDVFKKAAQYILDNDINESELEVNKLNIIKTFNTPKEEIQYVTRSIMNILGAKQIDEKLLINTVLATTSEDLKLMAKNYLLNAVESIVVATNEETINTHFSGWKKEIMGDREHSKPKVRI